MPANDAMVRFIAAHDRARGARAHASRSSWASTACWCPHNIAAYTYHLNNTSEITDAPTIRSLKFALADEFDDWRDGEMLLQSLIETPDAVRRAAARQGELEAIMVEAGGITGPGSIGFGVPDKAVARMRKFFPVDDLARDDRFYKLTMADRMGDPRSSLNLEQRPEPPLVEPAVARRARTPPTPPAR